MRMPMIAAVALVALGLLANRPIYSAEPTKATFLVTGLHCRPVRRTARDVRAYSRRQMTWFRRDGQIRWFDPTVEDPLPALLEAVA